MRPKTILATLAIAGMATLPLVSPATGLGTHSSASLEDPSLPAQQSGEHGSYAFDFDGMNGESTANTSGLYRTWYYPDGTVVYQYPGSTIVRHASPEDDSASFGSSEDSVARNL